MMVKPMRSLLEWPVLMVGVLAAVFLSGCSRTYETTKSARSPIEQLLLIQSLQFGLADAVPPVASGQSVAVEAVGLSGDQAVVASQIEKWLTREGFVVPKDGKESVVARVAIESFGTLQDETFFGIPPIGGGIIPISLPELAIYKASRQRGYSRFSVDFIDKKTGRLIRATPVHEGDSHYNQYTFFFAFNLNRTDLVPPPP
jgi:hypothetical protein